MKKLVIILLMVPSAIVFSQEYTKSQLDSMYDHYIQIREGISSQGTQVNGIPGTIADSVKVKCGFGIANEIRLHFNDYTAEQQIKLRKLLARPSTDTSIVSPKGLFRIHFYKSGNEKPAYSVDDLAIAADSAYSFEINFIGFPPPPSDNGLGGDNRYDIYIVNLGNEYGETDFDSEITTGSGKYYSYILVDNDFAGFYTTGINAARVTAAHEFNHVIQVGDYVFRDSDRFFHELTSTSMEIFVYTSIPDYLAYLPSYFNNTSIGFAAHGGYDLAIWNLFLKDLFGYGIIKRQWELMPQLRALAAINTSLTENSSTFGKEWGRFGVWVYYTNYRTVPGKYFPLAAKYPLVRSVSSLEISPPSKNVAVNTKAATNNFITFVNNSNRDTLVALISNIDYQNGIDSLNAAVSFQYSLYTDSTSGTFKLAPNYSASLWVAKASNWLSSEFLNNQLIRSDTVVIPPAPTFIAYAFPSPFYYGRNYSSGSQIYIPVSVNNNGTADLNIYSVSMKLVYSDNAVVFNNNGHPVVSWNARSSKNERLATGVYFFVTKSADHVIKGKLVIFNE